MQQLKSWKILRVGDEVKRICLTKTSATRRCREHLQRGDAGNVDMYDLARSHSVCFPELDVNVSNGETRTTAITRLQNEGFVTRVRYWENKNKCIHFKRSKAPFLFCPEC